MMLPRYAITAALVLLLAAVAAAIGWETGWGRLLHGVTPSPAGRMATLDSKILPAFGLAPLDANYQEMVERPLFIPTRRPAPGSAATQTAMKKGQFKLAGTTVSAGVSVAYLFEAATNKTHRVNMGADINGIKVATVETARVVLQQGGDSEELSLRTAASPKVVPTHVAAVSPMPGQPGQPGAPGMPGAVTAAMPPGAAMAVPGSSALPPGPGSGGQGPVPMMNASSPAIGAPGLPRIAPGVAENASPSADPNAVQTRRRRFQNLPQ